MIEDRLSNKCNKNGYNGGFEKIRKESKLIPIDGDLEACVDVDLVRRKLFVIRGEWTYKTGNNSDTQVSVCTWEKSVRNVLKNDCT